MKRFVFLISFLFSVSVLFSQVLKLKPVSSVAPRIELLKEASPVKSSAISEKQYSDKNYKSGSVSYTDFKQLGTSWNGYSTALQGNTFLWADPNLGVVTFTHRMNGSMYDGGDIACDISYDGGVTWQTDLKVYNSIIDPATWVWWPAKYPQGGILNPPGNTDPDYAFYTYFSRTIDLSNGPWGGYAFGSSDLSNVSDDPTRVNWDSGDDTWRLSPSAFHVTQQGIAWYFDQSSKFNPVTEEYDYTGKLIIGRGEIVNGEVAYEETLYDFLDSLEIFNDFKLAFAPDGQTGYLLAMCFNSENPAPFTLYHPVLLKTTDGGISWSDPIDIQLGGEGGIASIMNYWPDSAYLNAGYDIDPLDRETVYYNMGYHVDMVVDAEGNPFITGIIAIADSDGWYPYEGMMATWNLYSKDGGESWDADPLYDNIWFEGTVGDMAIYNRPQVSIDYLGKYIFYSWLDSDIDVAVENDRPNIYCIGYDSEFGWYDNVVSTTYFTQFWNHAFLGSQSYYLFIEDLGFNIPFTLVEFTQADDPLSPVNHWYFNFPVYLEDVIELNSSQFSLAVAQNFPNPASYKTEILVTGKTDSPIKLIVSDLLGKVIFTEERRSNAEVHSFNLDVSGLESGVYFYSVSSGNQTVTKKLIVN